MAYVHCHSCDWEQDDFWELRGYNPLRILLRDYLPMSIRPHMMTFDPKPYSYGRIHSWSFLVKQIARVAKTLWRQQWWTNASWKRSIRRNGGKWPVCPGCGDNNLDID